MKKCLLIEKFGKNSPIVKAVNKFKDKKELFFNMLDVMEFELIENINEKTNNKENLIREGIPLLFFILFWSRTVAPG